MPTMRFHSPEAMSARLVKQRTPMQAPGRRSRHASADELLALGPAPLMPMKLAAEPEFDTCSICIEPIDSSDGPLSVATAACKHVFHKTCLRQWCKQCVSAGVTFSCPICRTLLKRDFSFETDADRFVRAATTRHPTAALGYSRVMSYAWTGSVPANERSVVRRHRRRALRTDYLDMDLSDHIDLSSDFVDLDLYVPEHPHPRIATR